MSTETARASDAVRGSLALIVCAFCWSTAGLFIKLLDWSPFWIAGLRSLVASLLPAAEVAS